MELDKLGSVTIDFKILKDGTVAEINQVKSSGDVVLNRAAAGAIITSSPFDPLPAGYTGSHVTIRINFRYSGANQNPLEDKLSPAQK
jgi:TonB family protein